MGKKFWQTQKFKDLQRIWEFKLKDSGFKDVEDECKRLRQNSGNSYRTKELTFIEAKQRYYELLGQWQHEMNFRDYVERLIMERRANGIRIIDISLELKELGERHHVDTIRKVIRQYEIRWQIKKKF